MSYIKDEKNGNVAILTISRPQTFNALNEDVLNDLQAAVEKAASNKDIFVIIITGEGKAFVSGADIDVMKEKNHEEIIAYSKKGSGIFRMIEMLPKPVIAVINGVAFGGGFELAMACDIRLAGEKAKMGLPEATLGITPGFSGTVRLPRLIGLAKAKEWIYQGKIVNAQQAYEAGAVNSVFPQETLMEEAMKLAQNICSVSQSAIRLDKELLNKSLDSTVDEAIEREAVMQADAFSTPDQIEGMAAFKEKRKPVFNK